MQIQLKRKIYVTIEVLMTNEESREFKNELLDIFRHPEIKYPPNRKITMKVMSNIYNLIK